MKLNQLSLSFSSDEISRAVRTAASRAASGGAKLPPEIADLSLCVKDGCLVLSTKKKLGFMPVTIAANIALRPTAEGDGIVLTLKKISAGFIGSEAIASQLMGQIGQTLAGIPGCSVSGNDITLTKATLASKAPWLSVPGRISRFGIEGDCLEVVVG